MPTDTAFQDLEQALTDLPAQPDAAQLREVLAQCLDLGVSHYQANNLPQAISTWEQGLSLAAAHPALHDHAEVLTEILTLHINLGVSYRQAGKPAQAIATEEQGLSLAAAHPALHDHAEGLTQILKLHHNLGVSYGQAGKLEQAIAQYAQGLAVAQQALRSGFSSAWLPTIAQLYNGYLGSFYNQGLGGLVVAQLPVLCLWTWTGSAAGEAQNKQGLRGNWRVWLRTAEAPPESLSRVCAELWLDVLDWHEPMLRHFDKLSASQAQHGALRHFGKLSASQAQRPAQRLFGFINTTRLLAIAESLYALEQQTQAQGLREVLAQLTRVQRLLQQQRAALASAQAALQSCEAALPSVCDTWWQRLRYAAPLRRWRDAQATYQARLTAGQQLAEDTQWRKAVANTDAVCVKNLCQRVCQYHKIPTDLGSVADFEQLVAALLSLATPMDELAQAEMPALWQDQTRLQAVFAQTWWRSFLYAAQPLYFPLWLQSFQAPAPARRLQRRVAMELSHLADFETLLRQHLLSLLDDRSLSLSKRKPLVNLAKVWQASTVQAQAMRTALQQLKLPPMPEDELRLAALLGDTDDQLKTRLAQHFASAYPLNPDADDAQTQLAALEQRVNALLQLYPPLDSTLGSRVHDWAKALLHEQLASGHADVALLWQTLERARCGLLGLGIDLPKDWERQLGQLIWQGVNRDMTWFIAGHEPAADEPLAMLEVWLAQFDQWLRKPPSVAACQAVLPARHALLQAFFNPAQECLQWLWLDATGLRLLDLPDTCAAQALWFNPAQTGVVDVWMADQDSNWVTDGVPSRSLAHAKLRLRTPHGRSAEIDTKWRNLPNPQDAHWQAVMESTAVRGFATFLCAQAQQQGCTHVQLLLPAPLGQLPWEALPELTDGISRAVSLTHWYQTRQAAPVADDSAWVFVAEGEDDLALACNRLEAAILSEAWQTPADYGKVSPLQAVQRLQQTQQRVWLSTHGHFDGDAPLRSGLQLSSTAKKTDDDSNAVDLPLWLLHATRLECDWLMLSACLSNVTGADSAGWLAPLGIGPAFAAIGAKQVVGTLWSIGGVTSLVFAHFLTQVQQAQPNAPLFAQVAQARQRLRDISGSELEALKQHFAARKDSLLTERCRAGFVSRNDAARPFSHPMHWAGFVVMG